MIALAFALQVVSAPPGTSVDTSALATKAEVQAAQSAAAAASAKADTAASAAQAAQAAIPVPASTVPGMEMVGGSAGSTNTFRRGDAVQPRISRTVSGTTASGGTGTVSWPAMPSVPKLTVTPYVASNASSAPLCFPVTGTVTATGATIKCFSTQSVTVSLLGAVVAPITTAASGVTFDVLALPGS